MTDTPTTRRKRAPGAGRPPKPDRRFLLPIRCTEEVYKRILDNTTTEERAIILNGASAWYRQTPSIIDAIEPAQGHDCKGTLARR